MNEAFLLAFDLCVWLRFLGKEIFLVLTSFLLLTNLAIKKVPLRTSHRSSLEDRVNEVFI